MNFRNNLKELIADAHQFQYKEIGETTEENKRRKPRFYFTKFQWLVIFTSLTISILTVNGFDKDFCGYIISGLSLFIGMFFTFLITLYDKFRSIDFKQYYLSVSQEKYPIGQRLKNYFKKITVLSLYATIIALLCVVLLSISLMTKYLSLDTTNLHFINNWQAFDLAITVQAFLGFAFEFLTFYFLFDFLIIAIYIISAFYDFMMSEYNQINLKQ